MRTPDCYGIASPRHDQDGGVNEGKEKSQENRKNRTLGTHSQWEKALIRIHCQLCTVRKTTRLATAVVHLKMKAKIYDSQTHRGVNFDRDADICVYGCTGKVGRRATRDLLGLNTTSRILLAGRDPVMVKEVYEDLRRLSSANESLDRLIIHPTPVTSVDDFRELAPRAKVMCNCAVGSTALAAAQACIESGTHYVDLLTAPSTIQFMFQEYAGSAIKSHSCILPGCGFDYAVWDLALMNAENKFRTLSKNQNLEEEPMILTTAIHLGPQGIVLPIRLAEEMLNYGGGIGGAQVRPVLPPPKPQSSAALASPWLTYCAQLGKWTVPFGRVIPSLQFLWYQRRSVSGAPLDVRFALPNIGPMQLLKTLLVAIYSALVAPLLLAFLFTARFLPFLRPLALQALTMLSWDHFTRSKEKADRALTDMIMDLCITQGGKAYQVSVQANLATPLCIALAASIIAENRALPAGVLTPAQVLANSDEFWTTLQAKGYIQSLH